MLQHTMPGDMPWCAGSPAAGGGGGSSPGRLGNPAMNLWEDPRLDPDIREAMLQTGADQVLQLPPDVDTIAKKRVWINSLEAAMAALPRGNAVPEHLEQQIEVRKWTVSGPDGNDVLLVMKRPAGSGSKILPCLYHTHGGGMCIMSVLDQSYQSLYSTLVAEGGICVIGVEFRNSAGGLTYGPNAPPAPFPKGLNDCYAGLRHVCENKTQLGIGTVVVGGESGGGNLAIALALKAGREELNTIGGPSLAIAGVYAMCPFISGTYAPAPTTLPSLVENANYLGGLDNAAVQAMADVYTAEGTTFGRLDLDALAWPLRASDAELQRMPPHGACAGAQ